MARRSEVAQRIPSWRPTAVVGVLFGLAFMALAALPAVRNFIEGMGGTAVLASIRNSGLVPPLIIRVALFVTISAALHISLGLLAVGLTWLSEWQRPHLAEKRLGVLFLWFTALMLWICAANAYWFPRSEFVPDYARIVRHSVGAADVFSILTFVFLVWIASLSFHPLRSAVGLLTRSRRVASITLIAGVSLILGVLTQAPATTRPAHSTKPNIILIGADSLRLDCLRMFGGEGDAPVLDRVLREARVFSDTTTPLARTFPSWMSILSGRHPRSTGAWFNLVGRDAVHASPTIAHLLKEIGYRAVFATDEVRFSNIDSSYGFDTVITPEIGASDFVLGSVADTPLLNVIGRTPAGALLFPDVHANRAVAATYRPDDFSARLADELNLSEPMFLSVHFTTPHWPYVWADSPEPDTVLKRYEQFERYRAAVRAADRQIGEFLELLQERGVLDNAFVVFLSDHGEAMMRPGDSLVRADDPATARRVVAQQQGHGTSVLSPSQYQVLMAFAGYGLQRERIASGESDVPASLEDIAPTLLDLLGIRPNDSSFDGRSLAYVLASDANSESSFASRIRFTETDFTLPRMLAGDFNVKWLVEAAVPYYRVNSSNGWVEIKPDRLPEMMSRKERAAIRGRWLLAALPTVSDETLYAIVHRETGATRVVSDPEVDDDNVRSLFRALQERFPGELGRPSPFDGVIASKTGKGSDR